MSEWRFSAAHAGPVVATPEWEEMVRLEQELEKATARIRELEAELFEWRGCPACHTDHGPSPMCQPSKVLQARSERAMSQYDLWKARGRAAILQAQEAKAEITRLKETVGKSESLRVQELEAERHSLRSCTERINQERIETIALYDKQVAELERARDKAEAELDAALKRIADLKFLLGKASKLLDMAWAEPTLDVEHLERDRKRDEALRKISKQACDCGLFSQHEVSCPTSIAREVLKEG